MSSEKKDRCLYYSIVYKVLLKKKKKKKKITISLTFFGSFIILSEEEVRRVHVRRRGEGFRVAEVRYRLPEPRRCAPNEPSWFKRHCLLGCDIGDFEVPVCWPYVHAERGTFTTGEAADEE